MIIAFLTAGLICCFTALTVLGYLVFQTQVEIKAMMKSTHQVQYVRSDEFDKITEETKKALEKEFFDNIQ